MTAVTDRIGSVLSSCSRGDRLRNYEGVVGGGCAACLLRRSRITRPRSRQRGPANSPRAGPLLLPPSPPGFRAANRGRASAGERSLPSTSLLREPRTGCASQFASRVWHARAGHAAGIRRENRHRTRASHRQRNLEQHRPSALLLIEHGPSHLRHGLALVRTPQQLSTSAHVSVECLTPG